MSTTTLLKIVKHPSKVSVTQIKQQKISKWGYPAVTTFYWLDHMTSAVPIRAPARATSPPNALLRASEGARPVAAPVEVAFADEELVAELVADVLLDVPLEVAVEELAVSVAHSDC